MSPTSRLSEDAGARPVAVLLLAVIGCGGCESDLLRPQQEALDSARARWEAAGHASYTFVVERSCFCLTLYVRPMRIEVREGVVVEAAFADTGEPIPEEIEPPTVTRLFDEIQSAIDREAHSVVASYDPILGYPADVAIDFIEHAIDEEMGFRIHSLDPASSAGG